MTTYTIKLSCAELDTEDIFYVLEVPEILIDSVDKTETYAQTVYDAILIQATKLNQYKSAIMTFLEKFF